MSLRLRGSWGTEWQGQHHALAVPYCCPADLDAGRLIPSGCRVQQAAQTTRAINAVGVTAAAQPAAEGGGVACSGRGEDGPQRNDGDVMDSAMISIAVEKPIEHRTTRPSLTHKQPCRRTFRC